MAPRGRDRTGRWRQRQGDAPGAEDPIGARRRNLSRALRSPTLRRSPTPRTLDYTGKKTQPGPNWGGDPSCFPRAPEGRFSRRREPRRTGGTRGLESAGCARPQPDGCLVWIMREERAFYTQEVTPERAPDDPTTRNDAASLHVLVHPAVWSCGPAPLHQPPGPYRAQPPASSRYKVQHQAPATPA